MRNAFLPIALIVVGAGWLLKELHLFPDANWIVILGLISAGVLIMVLEGFNSETVIKGPMLIAAGVAAYLHLHQGWDWRILVPSLLILAGLLILASRSGTIPPPRRRLRNDRAE